MLHCSSLDRLYLQLPCQCCPELLITTPLQYHIVFAALRRLKVFRVVLGAVGLCLPPASAQQYALMASLLVLGGAKTLVDLVGY